MSVQTLVISIKYIFGMDKNIQMIHLVALKFICQAYKTDLSMKSVMKNNAKLFCRKL